MAAVVRSLSVPDFESDAPGVADEGSRESGFTERLWNRDDTRSSPFTRGRGATTPACRRDESVRDTLHIEGGKGIADLGSAST